MLHPPADGSGWHCGALPLYGLAESILTNPIRIIGMPMITKMVGNPLIAAAMTLLIFHTVESTALARQPSAAAGVDAPLDGCFYGVAPENKIAKGLKNVAVITDPRGAQGYEPDDVVFLFEGSSFAVARHAQEPYRITGDVPRAVVAALSRQRICLSQTATLPCINGLRESHNRKHDNSDLREAAQCGRDANPGGLCQAPSARPKH